MNKTEMALVGLASLCVVILAAAFLVTFPTNIYLCGFAFAFGHIGRMIAGSLP